MNGVYCLTAPNGKRYVGKGVRKNSKGIESRWNDYKKLRCKSQSRLYNALVKYGPENFKYEVILETSDSTRALKVEEQLIALWNLTNDTKGMNISSGGIDVAGNESRWNGINAHENKKKTSENTKKFHKEHPEHMLKHNKLFKNNLAKARDNNNKIRWNGENSKENKKHQSELMKKKWEDPEFRKKSLKCIDKLTGTNHHKAQYIKVKNELTQEVREGQLQHLCNELRIDRSTLVKKGKTKNWLLLEKRKYNG
jgi:group I intron endonuclease